LCQTADRKARRSLAAKYDAAFKDIPEIRLPVERPNVKHARHLYPIVVVEELLRRIAVRIGPARASAAFCWNRAPSSCRTRRGDT
jgi:hypothetical protein